MTIAELLELLIRFKAREITTKYLLHRLADVDLEEIARTRAGKPPVAKPPLGEPTNQILQSLFEGDDKPEFEGGVKEYYHAENKQGKRCFDDHRQKELEQGISYTDPGSSPFTANRPGRCGECGQVILKGDMIILRSKERVQS